MQDFRIFFLNDSPQTMMPNEKTNLAKQKSPSPLKLWSNVLEKRLCLQSRFWIKGSRLKGSEVDSPVTITREISGKEKSAKRLTLNREPGTF